MTLVQLLVWGLLLLLQNASFTMVSRARNSGSYAYHAFASVCSNGVWFASMFFVVDAMAKIREASSFGLAVAYGIFYTALTVVASVGMHWLLVTYVEKGKRKVGA